MIASMLFSDDMTKIPLQNVYIRIILLLSIILFGMSSHAARQTNQDLSGHTILVVGDSLSAAYGMQPQQGWVQLLQNRLQPYQGNYRVINASISGDTTAGGRSRLPALLKQYNPRIVIIQLGANDGLRGLSLKAMHSNLANMVRLAKSSGASVLLIGLRIPPNYGPQYTQKFKQVYRDLARKYRIPLVPYLLKGVGENLDNMQADTLHPKAQAQGKILENVWGALVTLL
jgi:acyl-CoA thioesterase-1